MKTILLLTLLSVLPAFGVATNILSSVSPASAAQGATNLLVTFTFSATPPPPPTTVTPKSVTIGSIAGTSPTWTGTRTITALFNIPGNETAATRPILR